MQNAVAAGVAVLFVLLSGCAKAPVLKVGELPNSTALYYTAEGGIALKMGDGRVCVVPPASGVRQISTDSSMNVKGGQGDVTVDVGGAHSVEHEVTKLFEQQQGVLFLQFAMYRLCEAFTNEAIDAAQYQTMFKEITAVAKEVALAEQKQAETAGKAAEAAGEAAKAARAQEERKAAEIEMKRLQLLSPEGE